MSNEKETVADIVAEMRQDIADGTVGMWDDFGGEIARGYVNRIEAASAREREAGADAAQICGEIGEIVGRESAIAELKRENERIIVDAQRDIETVSGKYGRLVKKLRSENKRLLSALKPVQDAHIPDFSICDTCYDRYECKGHESDVKCEWYDIVESVRGSQRIYKGGAK